MTKLSELEDIGKASPVIQDDQVSYIYVQYSNLYLLALARNNVNAIAILAFLHKLVEIFKHYFREVSLNAAIICLKCLLYIRRFFQKKNHRHFIDNSPFFFFLTA